jgi:hypothetical protein
VGPVLSAWCACSSATCASRPDPGPARSRRPEGPAKAWGCLPVHIAPAARHGPPQPGALHRHAARPGRLAPWPSSTPADVALEVVGLAGAACPQARCAGATWCCGSAMTWWPAAGSQPHRRPVVIGQRVVRRPVERAMPAESLPLRLVLRAATLNADGGRGRLSGGWRPGRRIAGQGRGRPGSTRGVDGVAARQWPPGPGRARNCRSGRHTPARSGDEQKAAARRADRRAAGIAPGHRPAEIRGPLPARGSGRCPLLCLDVDYLRRYNDQYGRKTGDQLLRSVADFPAALTREDDLIARWAKATSLSSPCPPPPNQALAEARDSAAGLRRATAFEGMGAPACA